MAMMTASELTMAAESFDPLKTKTCYLKGFWGQELTKNEYDRVLSMYPGNARYGNQKYIGDKEMFPFDCICFVKALLGGCTPEHRIGYSAIRNNPIGDCTNETFYNLLKKNPVDLSTAPAGCGLATKGHAGISLGNGRWIDCNYDSIQNGVKIHDKGIEIFDVAGKIPGVDYSEQEDEVKQFLSWIYEQWKERNKL